MSYIIIVVIECFVTPKKVVRGDWLFMKNKRVKSIQICVSILLLLLCIGMSGRLIYRFQSDGRFVDTKEDEINVEDLEENIGEDTVEDTVEEFVMSRNELIEEIAFYQTQIKVAENAIEVNHSKLEEYETAFKDFQEKAGSETYREEMIYEYYVNNAALVLSIKSQMLEYMGYEMNVSYTPQSEMDNFMGTLQDEIIDEIAGKVASGTTQKILAGGISGTIEGIKNSDDVSGVVDSIWSGIEQGFVAGLQEAPKEFIDNMLGVNILSTLEVLNNIGNIDSVPSYLIQLLKNDISNYASKIQTFLNDEYVTAAELTKALYWYEQYWDAVGTLNRLSGETIIEDHYVQYYNIGLDIDYERFKHGEAIYQIMVEE